MIWVIITRMHPKRGILPPSLFVISALLLTLAGGCGDRSTAESGRTPSPQISASATLTLAPPTPTPTPEPLSLRVNGEGVLLSEYEAQLIQIQAADSELGAAHSAEEQRQMAVDELVDQALLSRAAVQDGFELSEEGLDARLQKLISEAGSQNAFDVWLTQNGYNPSSFRTALTRSISAAWQRDRILQVVPAQAEQVRARQILVRTRETAEQLHGRLQSGSDFQSLAFQYDPLTGGELGWFPRGFLTLPAVEEAAFSLQAGEFSAIIETDFGYHILQVVEREEQRPLSPEALLALQQQALDNWFEEQRSAAIVEILLP